MDDDDQALIESIYGTALTPERFDELIAHWTQRVGRVLATEHYAGPQLESHLQTALEINDRLVQPEAIDSAQPTIRLARDGTVTQRNDAAALAYGIANGAHLDRLPLDSHTLQQLRTGVEGVGSLREASGLLIGQHTDDDRSIVLALQQTDLGLVVRTTDFVWPAHMDELLRDAFQFTEAELRVATLLAEGLNPSQVAASRSTSLVTVRAQMRSVYCENQCA